jgi:polyhydroxybutyrate depolymerase
MTRPLLRLTAALICGSLVAACSGGDDAGDGAGSAASGDDEAGAPATPADVEPRPSAGCGSSTIGAGQEKVTITSGGTSGGVERWYLMHVPPAHDGSTPVPVVVDLHGYSEGAEVHALVSQLGPYGDEQGFVTLTPHGQGEGPVPLWDTSPGSPDQAFLEQMLDDVEAQLCVDTARVFVTGLSNGAMMTSTLACELADRFAAAAPVAGVTEVARCNADRPVPVVAFHGTEDGFLAYEGGFGPQVASLPSPDGRGTLGDVAGQAGSSDEPTGPSVPEVMADWAAHNGCDDAAPEEEAVADDVTLLSFACPAGAEAELYRVEGGGHSWPGSELLANVEAVVGRTTMSISANEVMWEFFEQHPLVTGGGKS